MPRGEEVGSPTESDSEIEGFFRERGFSRTIGFGVKPAVVVIDFVRAFTDPSLPLGSDLHEEIAQAGRLLSAARMARVSVFFTSVAYDDHDLEDAGIWARKMEGVTTLRAGTPSVQVDSRLERQAHEPVIVKKYASSFFGTDLLTRLVTLRVDTLILVGCTTSGCVRATAVDGLQNGFRVMVAREAVGDRARSAHEQSLFDLHAKYADVVCVNDILDYFASLGGDSVSRAAIEPPRKGG